MDNRLARRTPREQRVLLSAVWPETIVSEGVITNCIGELRRALGDKEWPLPMWLG